MGRKKGYNWKSREVNKTEIVKNEDVSHFITFLDINALLSFWLSPGIQGNDA